MSSLTKWIGALIAVLVGVGLALLAAYGLAALAAHFGWWQA